MAAAGGHSGPVGYRWIRPLHARVAVVVAHGVEDVEHERAVGTAVRRMLDPAWKDVRLEAPELVCHPVDDERLHSVENDPELLVRMTMERYRRTRLEADEVQHRTRAEQRLTCHSRSQLERAHGVVRTVAPWARLSFAP